MAKSRTELVFVLNSLQSGGAEKQLLWMASALAQEGVRCGVFELQCKPGNVRLARLVDGAGKVGVEFCVAGAGETYGGAWMRFRRYLRENPGGIVWTWGFRADALMLTQAWLGGTGLWISSVRSANEQSIHRARWLIRLCRKHISFFVANTWAGHAILERNCPGVMSGCRVVYNVVEELAQKPTALPMTLPQPLRVVMLGNMVDRLIKGYDLTLDLAERLRADKLAVEIHVAGRPDSTDWLRREIECRHLGAMFFYHGETGDPLGFLRTGHVYLLMSRIEGMPNALLEAMSLGLPSIVTRVGDMERLARDGEHMRLIRVGGVDEAHAALRTMLENWPEAVAMGLRGRAWCEVNFNADVCKKQLIQVVEEVFSRRT